MRTSRLAQSDDQRDGAGQPLPLFGLTRQRASSEARERIEFGASIVLRLSPLGRDPSLLLELVEGRVERAVAHLEDVLRDRLETLADGPAIHRLEGEHL